MGSTTKIEWTSATWNPVIGCSRVSEGCRHCYAERIAARFGNGKATVYSGLTQIVNGAPVWTGKITETRKLLEPLSWRKPKVVFVNSMSDLFHENIDDNTRDRIFAVMALTPQHTYQVLTKRPERMLNYFAPPELGLDIGQRVREAHIGKAASTIHLERTGMPVLEWAGLPMPNVWLGVSVEDQTTANKRIPMLLKTPAAGRFLSCEPLLGPIDLRAIRYTDEDVECEWNALTAYHEVLNSSSMDIVSTAEDGNTRLDWVIAGGESGPGSRPVHPEWIESLRDQCEGAFVPFFFKQWGDWLPYRHGAKPTDRYGQHGLIYRDGTTSLHSGTDHADPEMGLYTSDLDGNDGAAAIYRVGKTLAGAKLFGKECREFPPEILETLKAGQA